MSQPLESAIQSKIIDRYARDGWMCVRLIQTNCNGIPDLLLLRDGVARFIEVKRKGCKPRPLQDYRIKQLKALGFDVDVFTD